MKAKVTDSRLRGMTIKTYGETIDMNSLRL